MTNRKAIKEINNFIEENIDNSKNYSWKKGYSNLGILLVGFCAWLYKSTKSSNSDKLFFLSREGYLIKKAYEVMYPKEKCKYLYVSRKSLSLPSMKSCKTIKEELKCVILPPMFTIDILLNAFGLKENEFNSVIKDLKIDKNEQFYRNTFKEDERILKLIERLNKEITENINRQFENFTRYLRQEQFNGNVAIVDIGWHNSMQNLLLNIVKDTKIKGYYFGVYKDGIVFQNGNNANGYLYSYGSNIERQHRTFSFVSLFETMLLAHEGTTKNYQEKDKKIVPVLADYEYTNEFDSLELVKDFQNGAIKFVEDFTKNKYNNIELTPEICSYNLLKFGSNPSKKDIEVFGKLTFENYKMNNIINFNKNSIYYFTHLHTMKEDFYKSGWRVAFLKKLFKIPLPYFYIIRILCSIFIS